MPQVGKDLFQAQGLTYDVYCAACGYNLRTRPRLGRCPECGNEYDSRPLSLKGLLGLAPPQFPWTELRNVFLAALVTGVFVLLGLDGQMWAWFASAPFVVALAVFLFLTVRQIIHWWHAARILRETRREVDERSD